MRDLHRQNRPWLPAGLGSRLHWGAPVAPCPVVSTAALGGIRDHSLGDFTLTVGAGTPLVEIQEALGHHGQWLALDAPFVEPAAAAPDRALAGGSIGGLVARGLAGGYRERYLGVRDQLIGVRLLRADGVEAQAGGRVVKNVAGYDLMRLLCGSWGSLALITELTLRTMPIPRARGGVGLAGPLATLLALRARLLASGLAPERLDLWNAPLAAAAQEGTEPLLLVGLASVNQASLEAQGQVVAHLAEGLSLRRWEGEGLEDLLARGSRSGPGGSPGGGWLLRLGVLPSQLGDLLERPELTNVAVNMAAGSGLGLAWAASDTLTPAQVLSLRRCCGSLGGHLTVLRQPSLPPSQPGAPPPPAGSLVPPAATVPSATVPATCVPAWQDAPSRPLIEAIKAQFDPQLQLAPGRLPGVEQPRRA